MNAYKVVALSVLALSSLLTVGRVGKPVRPLTPSLAVGSLIVNAGLAVLVVLS